MAALQAWMALLDAVPPKLAEHLSQSLRDKESLRRAHLLALLQVVCLQSQCPVHPDASALRLTICVYSLQEHSDVSCQVSLISRSRRS